MSTQVLEALRDSGLTNRRDRPANVEKMKPLELRKRLDQYHSRRADGIESDVRENSSESGMFSAVLSSVSAESSIVSILPSCFIYSRLYVNDPLMRVAAPKDGSHHAYNKHLGLDVEDLPDSSNVMEMLHYFASLAPLIRLGVVSILPLETLHSVPKEGVPIFYSEDGFRSEVPNHIHDFVHRQAVVGEITPAPDGKALRLLRPAPGTLSRGISIQFSDDAPSVRPPFYLLADTKLVGQSSDGRFTLAQQVDWENPPEQEMFDAWLYQSVNRTIINRLQRISREMVLAQELQASYLTESKFEAELCGLSLAEPQSPSRRTTAVNFLDANAPYLQVRDPAALARLLASHPLLFRRWQDSLLAATSELNGCGDDFDERSRMLFAKEIQPQMDELESTLTKLSTGVGGSALLAVASIGMALLSNESLPLSAVLGYGAIGLAGQSLPSVAEYISMRRRPAFLWKRLSK